MPPSLRPTGMLGFSLIWIGQLVSVLASSMTVFGLTIWMYQQTQSATAMGLVQVCFITPFVLMSPFAGVLVDRHDRRLMMMVSDLAAGLGTTFVLVLFSLGQLEPWHLYLAAALNGVGNAFQWPAYSAAISTMVPKAHYGRANGMMTLVETGPAVLAPLLAGALLPLIGLAGVMLIDILGLTLALGTLLLVHIPQPRRTQEGAAARGNLWQESLFGFKYILARPGLLGLQAILFFGNFFSSIAFTLLPPMILARTAQDSLSLGTVESAGAMGGLLGAIAMSAWSGFSRKVHGVLLGWMLASIASACLGLGQMLPVWAAAMAITVLHTPLIHTSNQAIWQSKVPPELQGRVFSARRMIALLTTPIAPIVAGTLADLVLEPAMRTHNAFSSIFGAWVGTGPGAGMALLIVFCGIGGALAGLSGYWIPAIRNVETILPDHDALPPPP